MQRFHFSMMVSALAFAQGCGALQGAQHTQDRAATTSDATDQESLDLAKKKKQKSIPPAVNAPAARGDAGSGAGDDPLGLSLAATKAKKKTPAGKCSFPQYRFQTDPGNTATTTFDGPGPWTLPKKGIKNLYFALVVTGFAPSEEVHFTLIPKALNSIAHDFMYLRSDIGLSVIPGYPGAWVGLMPEGFRQPGNNYPGFNPQRLAATTYVVSARVGNTTCAGSGWSFTLR